MSKNKYRKHNGEYKIKLLQQHLIDKVPVSELCDKEGIKPSLFYKWQQDLFKYGHEVFSETKPAKTKNTEQEKITSLEAKLAKKDHVLAELMEEYVALKKELGEG